MKNREYGDYIEDILNSVDVIEEFVKGMNFEDFIKDKKTVFAVSFNSDRISPRVGIIPPTKKLRLKHQLWKE